jgi:hypothetical protein
MRRREFITLISSAELLIPLIRLPAAPRHDECRQ